MKDLNLELSKALLLNFFDSHYYLVFDSQKEVEEFLEFISNYDSRFDKKFPQKKRIKSVYWNYSKILHKHILDWMDDETYFKKYGAEPLKYKEVKKYIYLWLMAIKKINERKEK